jgi:hypothetical protein
MSDFNATTLTSFATDRVLGGMVYIVYVEDGTYKIKLATSDDYGDTWSTEETGWTLGSPHGLQVYNGLIAFCHNTSSLAGFRVAHKIGGSWGYEDNDGYSTYAFAPHALSPTDNYHYFLGWDSGHWLSKVDRGQTAVRIPFDGNYREWFDQFQLWFHPDTAGTVRFVVQGGQNTAATIITTTDHFDNYNESDLPYFNIEGMCWKVTDDDTDLIIYAGGPYQVAGTESPTQHMVLVADAGSDITNLTGRGGSAVDTPPYTDSIPYNCGGIIEDGIWVIA